MIADASPGIPLETAFGMTGTVRRATYEIIKELRDKQNPPKKSKPKRG